MNPSIETEFLEHGYVWLKKVLSDDEVDKLRDRIFQVFDERKKKPNSKYYTHQIDPSTAYWTPEIWQVLLKEKLVNALKSVLEPEYSLIPDLHVQKNKFGLMNNTIAGIPIPGQCGWHIDAGSESMSADHLNPEYRFVKCGLYLQDNDPDYGGGIDIIPQSHKLPLSSGIPSIDWQARRIKSKLGIIFRRKTMPIKKGDMVLFHSFLMHKGSSPKPTVLSKAQIDMKNQTCLLPREHTKLVVYFNACRQRFAYNFMQHNLTQAKKIISEAQKGRVPRGMSYCDEVSLRSAKGFPEELTSQLKKNKIHMASLTGEDLEEATKIRQEALHYVDFE